MKFQHGQFVVEFRVVNFAPINEVEVVLRFAQRENLDPERGEDEVGVAGTATGEAAEEQGGHEEGEGHPPAEGGMSHQPSDGDEKSKGKGDGCDHHESLGLGDPGEAEFLVRFGDFLWRGHGQGSCGGRA